MKQMKTEKPHGSRRRLRIVTFAMAAALLLALCAPLGAHAQEVGVSYMKEAGGNGGTGGGGTGGGGSGTGTGGSEAGTGGSGTGTGGSEAGTGGSGAGEKAGGSPKTGDTQEAAPYWWLALASGAAIAVTAWGKRRRQEERE